MSASYILASHSLSAIPSISTPFAPSPSTLFNASPNPSSSSHGRTDSNAAIPGHSDAIWCTSWTTLPNQDEVVLTAGADRSLKLWDTKNSSNPVKSLVTKETGLGIVGMDVEKDVGGAGSRWAVTSSMDSVICKWSLEDHKLMGRCAVGPAESWSVATHPNTSLELLATGGQKDTIRVLSSATSSDSEEVKFGQSKGRTEANNSSDAGFVLCVKYSPTGDHLATTSSTGFLTLYDTTTLSPISIVPAHALPTRSLSFTPSSPHLLVTGSDDGRVHVFDVRALGGKGTGGRRGQVGSFGAGVLGTGGAAEKGKEGWVTSVECRNGRVLAAGSSDGLIRLYDLSTVSSSVSSTPLSTLRDHTGDVWSLSWAPDSSSSNTAGLGGQGEGIGGGRLVSAGEDAGVRWWRGGG